MQNGNAELSRLLITSGADVAAVRNRLVDRQRFLDQGHLEFLERMEASQLPAQFLIHRAHLFPAGGGKSGTDSQCCARIGARWNEASLVKADQNQGA